MIALVWAAARGGSRIRIRIRIRIRQGIRQDDLSTEDVTKAKK
jgi:hypothetical protein